MATTDDFMRFADEAPAALRPPPSNGPKRWKILIADDEPSVHLVTQLALGGFVFEQRGLELLSAYNEADVKRLMTEHPDMAVILLDVVMDSLHSGFDLIRYIRQDLQNKNVRIILRTGQSGHAPEDRVIIEYDINDFKDKTELTVAKLRTAIISSLRNFQNQVFLDQARGYYQQVLDQTSSCLITVDRSYRVKLWNRAAETLFGKARSEAEGQLLWQVHPWFANIEGLLDEVFRQEAPSEHRNVPFSDRGNLLLNLTLTPMRDQQEREILVRVDDVTEIRRKEEQIGFIEKIHTVGSFHRLWANYIARVRSELSALAGTLSENQDRSLASRLTELSQDLTRLPFALPDKPEVRLTEMRTLGVDALLQQTLARLGPERRARVLYRSDVPGATIQGSPIPLVEALGNFLQNLLDAEPSEDVRVQFQLSRTWMPEDRQQGFGPLCEKSYLCLSVDIRPSGLFRALGDDFGRIAEDVPLRGLYFSFGNLYQTVLEHRGFMELDRFDPDRSRIEVFLPELSATSPRPRTLEVLELRMERGTILVCDDDSIARQVTASILSQFGFQVLLARTGHEALALLEQSRSTLRLVILDLLLPEVEGPQVFEEIKRIAPEIPVLFSSGFGKNERVRQALENGAAGFLQKPYTMDQLMDMVFSAIGENAQSYDSSG